jgi:kanamycin kinase
MTEQSFEHLAKLHTLDGLAVPRIVHVVAGGDTAELVWRNDLGGLTFRLGDRYLKVNPSSTGIDLDRERVRLGWIAERHPAPLVIDHGLDGDSQWMLTKAVPGDCAVGDAWRARRPKAIQAVATGLRAMHAIEIDDFPPAWSTEVWVGKQPESLGPRPPIDDPVVVHGDA